jgi:GNAT superfamily N-acetyltransferase
MVTTDAIDVRPAKRVDIAAVLEVDHVAERADEVRRAVEDARCLVAEIAGELVGFCVSGRFFGFDFLDLLVVQAAYRRQRVGTVLLEAWERTAHTPKLFTSTNESNVPMQRLCERLGYIRSGFIENLDEGDPEVIYFKVNNHPQA